MVVRPDRRHAWSQGVDDHLRLHDVRRVFDDCVAANVSGHRCVRADLAARSALAAGLVSGAEYGTGATYLSEASVRGRRGFFGAFQYFTIIAGQLLALLIVVTLQSPFENSPPLWCKGGMWKKEHREREAKLGRKTKRYPSDLTDIEWAAVQPLLPRAAVRGRRRECDLREVVNALRYLVRAGCGWRMLSHDFPPWQTVYWWFRRLMRRLLFRTLHDVVLMLDRELAGRQPCRVRASSTARQSKRPRPTSVATTRPRKSSGASGISRWTRMDGC